MKDLVHYVGQALRLAPSPSCEQRHLDTCVIMRTLLTGSPENFEESVGLERITDPEHGYYLISEIVIIIFNPLLYLCKSSKNVD